jgi:RND family efflux transporter MFP subunit
MSDQLSNDLASLRIEKPVAGDPKTSKKWGWVVALIVIAALAAGAVIAQPAIEASLFKTEVDLTEVLSLSPATVATEVTASGYVIPQVISKIVAKVEGRIAKMEVREGAVVKKGSVLFVQEDADQKAAVAAAEARALSLAAEAKRQQVQLGDNERRLKRQRALAADGVIGRASVEDLEAEAQTLSESVKAAEANVAAARAELRTKQVVLEHFTVRAPIDGTVLVKPPSVGDLVSPTSGAVFEIADFSSLTVEVDVPEGRLPKVRIGGPCEISLDAYPSRRFRGVVKEISPMVNRAKATAVVKVAFHGDIEGVLPNMAARAFFLEDDKSAEQIGQPPKTVVPKSAVVKRDGAPSVFVVDGDRVHLVSIEIGPEFGSGYELVSGPRVGTRLVKDPPPTLAEGHRIKQRNAK